MPYEQKPGQGTLWRNSYKAGDNHPDAKGTIMAHRDIYKGEVLDIAAWTKTKHDGERFQSLKISDKRERQSQTPKPHVPGAGGEPETEPLDDRIPFIMP